MQTKEILRLIKLFVISFIFIALVWAGAQQFLSSYLGISLDTPLSNIALYAGMIAIVVTTAQWVLNPRKKTAEDVMRERMAEAGNVMAAPQAEQAAPEQEDAFEPAPPPVAAKPRARTPAKKKAAKKGRR